MSEVVVITGAGRGIRRGLVEAVLRAGGVAVAVDADAAALEELSSLEARHPGRLERHALGVGDLEAIRRLFEGLVERHGRLDALVNGAAVLRSGPSGDVADEDWAALIRPDIKAMFRCTTAAVPHMLRCGRGKVINLTVGEARGTSKDRVVAFTQQLGRELAQRGIRVNAVSVQAARRRGMAVVPNRPAGAGAAAKVARREDAIADAVAAVMFLISAGGDGYSGQVLSRPPTSIGREGEIGGAGEVEAGRDTSREGDR